MGKLIEKKIDYARTWIDPSKEEPIPDLDYNIVLPISVYDAIHKTTNDESATLTDEIANIYSEINKKQDIVEGGTAGSLMTWTSNPGVIGESEILKSIADDDADRSYLKIPSEKAVGKSLDLKADKVDLNKHINDTDIHITLEEREKIDSMASAEAMNAHMENEDIHVTAEQKETWDAKVDAEDLDAHVNSYTNPHKVSAHQVGTYTTAEIDDFFDSIQQSFFDYKNISYDTQKDVGTIVEHDEGDIDPNYILAYGDELPTPTDLSLTYFAIKPVSDYSTNPSDEVILYIKEPSLSWREIGTSELTNGSMLIRSSDAGMYVWIDGRFIVIDTKSSEEADESTLMWRPVIDSDGVLTFVRSTSTTPPDPVTIKGPAGYTPVKGVDYFDGADGIGIPEGGEDGEIIVKSSGDDYDTKWMSFADFIDAYVDPAKLPSLLSDWNNIKNKPEIYQEFGGDTFGLVSQNALTEKFSTVDSAIKDLQDIVGDGSGMTGLIEDHINDRNNPHGVNAAQIGAVSTTTFLLHSQNQSNPHNVTAKQLGLDMVNNTSDADKPISVATQAALDDISLIIKDIQDKITDDTLVNSVHYEDKTSTLQFGFLDGSALEVTLPFDEVFESVAFDDTTRELSFTLPSGEIASVNLGALVSDYIGGKSDTIETTIVDRVITSSVRAQSIDGTMLVDNIALRGLPSAPTQAVTVSDDSIATTGFVKKVVIDSLDSYDRDRPLSANMGRLLNANKASTQDVINIIEKSYLIEVVNDLTSTSATAALSANMGRVLNETKTSVQDVIDIIEETPCTNVIDDLTSTDKYAALSANMGRVLDLKKAEIVHTSSSGAVYGRSTADLFGHARASSVDPLMDGEAELGTDDGYFARGDHRHPTDVTRAPINWPDGDVVKMTGEFRAESPSDDSDDDRVATTEWVRKQAGSAEHLTDYNNPHRVTAEQVGLGNVDNTSDADKPVSTAVENRFVTVENSITVIEQKIPSTETIKELINSTYTFSIGEDGCLYLETE